MTWCCNCWRSLSRKSRASQSPRANTDGAFLIDYKLPIPSLLGVADFGRIAVWILIAEHIDFVTLHSETLRINKQFFAVWRINLENRRRVLPINISSTKFMARSDVEGGLLLGSLIHEPG
jgi:hypothetical protein